MDCFLAMNGSDDRPELDLSRHSRRFGTTWKFGEASEETGIKYHAGP